MSRNRHGIPAARQREPEASAAIDRPACGPRGTIDPADMSKDGGNAIYMFDLPEGAT